MSGSSPKKKRHFPLKKMGWSHNYIYCYHTGDIEPENQLTSGNGVPLLHSCYAVKIHEAGCRKMIATGDIKNLPKHWSHG